MRTCLLVCTVVMDRYGGTYSGGVWTAWEMCYDEVPVDPSSGDNTAESFWEEHRRNPEYPIGLGDTADQAVADLEKKRGYLAPDKEPGAVDCACGRVELLREKEAIVDGSIHSRQRCVPIGERKSGQKPVLARWGIWLTNVGTWRLSGERRSVFLLELDARTAAGPNAEARPLPLDEPTGQPVCPRCARRYGVPHALGCELVNVDDNGFGDDEGEEEDGHLEPG